MVNVGLSILRGEATGDKDTLQARRFALRLLKKYADVDIPTDEFEQWAEKGATPFLPTSSMSSSQFSLLDSIVKENAWHSLTEELLDGDCVYLTDYATISSFSSEVLKGRNLVEVRLLISNFLRKDADRSSCMSYVDKYFERAVGETQFLGNQVIQERIKQLDQNKETQSNKK